MNSQPDEDDVKFARSLVNPEKSTRDKTLATFRKYLASQTSLEHMEMLKIWKALYYCMWLSDKQPIQAELAQNLCDLMDVFSTPQLSLLYFRMFFRIMLREWAHLDQYRVNKFYSLIRLMFRKALSSACKASWSSDFANAVLNIVDEEVLTKKPNGIRYHIADIYLSELHQVTNGDINTRDFLTALKPVQDCLLRLGDNADFTDRLYKEVFNKFASQFAAENASEDAAEQKVFAGVNTKALQKIIFDLAADEATPNPCRKKLYELHKVLAARSGANFVSESLDELLGKKSAAKAAATPGKKDKKETGKKDAAPAVVPPVTPKAPAVSATTPAASEKTEKKVEKAEKKSEKKAKRAHSEIEEEQEEVPAPKALKSALKAPKESAVKTDAASKPVVKKDKSDKTEKTDKGDKKKDAAGEQKKEVDGEKSAKKAKAAKDSVPETSSTTPSNKAAKREEGSSPSSAAASAPEAVAPPKYIASAKFAGRKPGYVFKKDKQGLGYYWDAVQARQLARKSVGAGSSSNTSSNSDSAKKGFRSQSAPASGKKHKGH